MNRINKKLIFLLSIPIFGFVIFVVVHFSFLNKIQHFSHKSENLRVKQLISSDINYNIIKIKSLLYKMILISSNKNILEVSVKEVKRNIQKTKYLLEILQKGGHYKRDIELNLVGKDNFQKDYCFQKTKVSFEVIELMPKLDYLNIQLKKIQLLLIKRTDAKKLKSIRRKIAIFTKQIDSVFRRMIENSNRLFYESQINLSKLELEIENKKQFYASLEFGLIILLVLSFIAVGYFVLKTLMFYNYKLSQKLYIDELTQAKTRVALEEENFTENTLLILLDIDGFSDINELYGMEIGNQVLQEISGKLRKYLDFPIFRVSADVFGIFIEDMKYLNMSVVERINYIKNLLEDDEFIIDDNIIDINVTIGVAVGKHALHDSLAALNMAKEKNISYEIFEDDKQFKYDIEFSKKWKQEIKNAIKENRIKAFVQPIVDKYKQIQKYECLMRMEKIDDKGNIKYIPPVYLDVAMRTKQYLSISKMMIENSFEVFKEGGEFSINLSFFDIRTESMKEFLEELIVLFDVSGKVTFEILESEGIEDYNLVKEFLDYFREKYDVKIAIDDFGSGYSNFKRIMDLKPDFIKIDGSLIKDIAVDSNSFLLVKTMVSYAKELKIKVIAEYVHNKETFDTCKYLEIDLFQGYYFSPPVKLVDLADTSKTITF